MKVLGETTGKQLYAPRPDAGMNMEKAALYRQIGWRVLPFLMICYMFAYLDRINIGFAKLQMQSDIGLTDTAYGLGAGIFFLGYVLFEIPSNLLLPKVGARRTISRITVFWAMPSGYLKGDAAAGGIAYINTVGLLGGFLSPIIMGWVKDMTGTMTAGLFVMVGLLVAGALLTIANRLPVDSTQ